MTNNAIYTNYTWNRYAKAHASVTVPIYMAICEEISRLAKGTVADYGCGSGKLLPYLAANDRVKGYYGIDKSPEMLKFAAELAHRVSFSNARFLCHSIEHTPLIGFDFGFSVHSYYTWPDPKKVLCHIHATLKTGARFVLVTPNKNLDIEKLISECDKSMLMHPDYDVFKHQNSALIGNEKALFEDMGQLVKQVQEVGFQVIECHQRHYFGGVNFLHLLK